MADVFASRRNVLLITNNLPPVRGGSGVVYDNIARHGQGRIIVIAPRTSYQDGLPQIGWREHDRVAPYPVVRCNLLRTILRKRTGGFVSWLRFRIHDAAIRLQLLTTMIRLMRRHRIAAVCIGELVASAWVLRVLRFFPRVTRLVYVHGEEITTQDGYDVSRERRRAALQSAHRIIVVSRFAADAVTDLLGAAAKDRVYLVENGVDASHFMPLPRSADLLDRYGLTGNFTFISVSRLLEKKGIDLAIKAFARVVSRYPDSRFLVVGEGPYRETLEKLAAASDVAGKVIFTGAVSADEIVDHYVLGDVFVMPNRRLANGDTEGFGLVFLEANACGLPVIAGSDGGSTDAVRHAVNGLVVDGHSVDAIAEAMLALHADRALRKSLREGGRLAAAAADWHQKTRDFLEIATTGADRANPGFANAARHVS